MWLFTKYGYFAVVRDYDNENIFWLRARVKRDIENILQLTDLKNPEIIVKGNADYKFRVKILKGEYKNIMSILVDSLDYSNFKNMMDDNADQRHKIFAYYEVYNVLAEHFDTVESE
jgi:hypothetical protein